MNEQIQQASTIVKKLEEYVSRRSLAAFIAVSFFVLVSAVTLSASQASQRVMLEVSNITNDQRILLMEVSDKIIFLLKNSDSGTSDRFIEAVQVDISNKIEELNNNQKQLKLSPKKQSSLTNLWPLSAFYPVDDQIKLIDRIGKNLDEMTYNVGKLTKAKPTLIKAGFNFWDPNYLTLVKNGKHTGQMSKLNELIYTTALEYNENLASLHRYLLLVVIIGIWLIWVYILKPLSNQVTHQFKIIQQSQGELRHQARYDSMTGLMNRQSFSGITERTSHGHDKYFPRIATIIIDVDEFKVINDSFGHQAGDQVLQETAKRLQQDATEHEQAFRIGGDEFAIIMQNAATAEEVESRVKQLSELCSQPIQTGTKEIFAHVSIGVAYQEKSGNTVQELFTAADFALYQVKSNGGKNYAFFTENDELKISELLKMSAELDKALENKEIEIYYQPIIRVKDRRIVGLEALARWNHPEKGLLSAQEWLSSSKRTNFLSEVSVFALEQIELDTNRWADMNSGSIQVNINATEKLLVSGFMLERLNTTLQHLNRSNNISIGIEIPESIILDRNLGVIIEQLITMREAGFKILLDDFGTGYATLSHLVSLPFDSIKVDRQFCKNVTNSSAHRAIIKTLRILTNELNKDLICEGVENLESLKVLSELGCEYVQGHYYSEAVSAERITELLQRQSLDD